MLKDSRSLLPRYGVALVSAWYGGLGPGLVTTALCATAASYFWLVHFYSLAPKRLAEWVGLGLAVLVMVMIAWITAALRRSQDGERTQREYLQVTLASTSAAV